MTNLCQMFYFPLRVCTVVSHKIVAKLGNPVVKNKLPLTQTAH